MAGTTLQKLASMTDARERRRWFTLTLGVLAAYLLVAGMACGAAFGTERQPIVDALAIMTTAVQFVITACVPTARGLRRRNPT